MNKGEDFIGVGIIYLCHDGNGNFLLHKRGEKARDENGKWDIGGGALEFGEKVEDTLKREIKEEYGTDVLSYEFIGFRDVHREKDGKPTHWIALDFKVLVDVAKVKNGEPHKFDDFRWFTIGQLPSPLHSQLPAFFEKYEGKL
mgnify:CR=1 FL=1